MDLLTTAQGSGSPTRHKAQLGCILGSARSGNRASAAKCLPQLPGAGAASEGMAGRLLEGILFKTNSKQKYKCDIWCQPLLPECSQRALMGDFPSERCSLSEK